MAGLLTQSSRILALMGAGSQTALFPQASAYLTVSTFKGQDENDLVLGLTVNQGPPIDFVQRRSEGEESHNYGFHFT